jgi:CheY-like chemotaxis protein
MNNMLAGRRVLIVEDEMLILMGAEDMLLALGCELVNGASTVAEAIALIDAQRFDAALLDVNLGGSSSDRVADKLAERGVPFAFATGYSERDGLHQHRDRPVLKKPFRHDELAKVLTSILR